MTTASPFTIATPQAEFESDAFAIANLGPKRDAHEEKLIREALQIALGVETFDVEALRDRIDIRRSAAMGYQRVVSLDNVPILQMTQWFYELSDSDPSSPEYRMTLRHAFLVDKPIPHVPPALRQSIPTSRLRNGGPSGPDAAFIARAPALVASLVAEVERLREAKDNAYAERNRLVVALSKVFPAWLERHPDADVSWEDDWRWIVFVALPTGQASWHIHDSELAMFSHLERRAGNSWDGHTTEQKYERVASLEPRHD